MKPRKLSVVRIRDLEEPSFSEPHFADVPGHFQNFCALASDRKVFRISGSDASQMFWKHAKQVAVPDLILADINFERDLSSPLREQFVKIPTGILHSLPFLTWSRVGGTLSVVVFNTHDPNVFRQEADPPMRLLAAELGVLAMAIAGDLEKLVAPNDLRHVYDWLAHRTAPNEDEALRTAVVTYRRQLIAKTRLSFGGDDRAQLPPVVINPANYGQLVSLAESAANLPVGTTVPVESWPGLELIYADGRRDSLCLASLFGEVPSLHAEDFLSSVITDHPEVLNTLGRPCVRAYLASLGGWHEVYTDAVKVEARLLCREDRLENSNLNRLVPASNDGRHQLVRALAIVFHVVRQAYLEWSDWETAYRAEWNLRTASGQPILEGQATVRQAYKAIWGLLKKLGTEIEGPITEEDLLSAIRDDDQLPLIRQGAVETLSTCPEWLTRACDALESLGLVEYVQLDGKRALTILPRSFPQLTPVKGRTISPNWVSVRSLLANTGFNSHRQLYDACTLPSVINGSTLLSEIIDGRCPSGWLRELAREFALDVLRWNDDRSWPKFLHDAPPSQKTG